VGVAIQLVLSTVQFWHQRAFGLDENGQPTAGGTGDGDGA